MQGLFTVNQQPEPPFNRLELVEDYLFRPIHYLGSKFRMLDFIEKTINEVEPQGRVCDLFAGSGSVSFKMSLTRPVTAVDIQEYSRVICKALLHPISIEDVIFSFFNNLNDDFSTKIFWAIEPLVEYENYCVKRGLEGNPEELCVLLENGSIVGYELGGTTLSHKPLSGLLAECISRLRSLNLVENSAAICTRHFGGIYFSYIQCAYFDIILHNIQKLKGELRDTFLAALLSTASDAVNTIGKQFAQPIRPRKADGTPKPAIARQVEKDRSIDILSEFRSWLHKYSLIKPAPFDNDVIKADYSNALDKLPSDIKVIYADPPYTRDHYSRFYHVLETICLRDNPQISLTKIGGLSAISRGIYRESRHQSPFCIKSEAPKAFENLISKARSLEAVLILSYSPFDESKKVHPRLLTMSQLLNIAKKYFSSVEVVSPGTFFHSKLTHAEKHLEASSNAEVLVICQP